jgi:hypothetical protein
MSYSDESKAHDERVKGLVALYNARRLDDMLEHFCDDVICFLPTVLADSPIDIQWSNGKETYRRNLAIFYDLFGTLTVEGVFATKDSSSVLVTDEHGNNGTFSFEVTAERKVKRVFFHHQPARAAKASVPGIRPVKEAPAEPVSA